MNKPPQIVDKINKKETHTSQRCIKNYHKPMINDPKPTNRLNKQINKIIIIIKKQINDSNESPGGFDWPVPTGSLSHSSSIGLMHPAAFTALML